MSLSFHNKSYMRNGNLAPLNPYIHTILYYTISECSEIIWYKLCSLIFWPMHRIIESPCPSYTSLTSIVEAIRGCWSIINWVHCQYYHDRHGLYKFNFCQAPHHLSTHQWTPPVQCWHSVSVGKEPWCSEQTSRFEVQDGQHCHNWYW